MAFIYLQIFHPGRLLMVFDSSTSRPINCSSLYYRKSLLFLLCTEKGKLISWCHPNLCWAQIILKSTLYRRWTEPSLHCSVDTTIRQSKTYPINILPKRNVVFGNIFWARRSLWMNKPLPVYRCIQLLIFAWSFSWAPRYIYMSCWGM